MSNGTHPASDTGKVHIDTNSFRALTGRIEQLEQDLAEVNASLPLLTMMHSAGYADGYAAGVESILGRPAAQGRPKPGHLHLIDGA
jgi:hypothetical protein